MLTRPASLAAALLLAISPIALAQERLVLYVVPEPAVAYPGDTVTWTFYAELDNPDPNKTIEAVVSNITFDLSHSDPTNGLVISNNSFQPAFDSAFFGPADDGVIAGTQILGASGINTIPPLNNPDGPDSRNPLPIYTYDTLITDPTPRTFLAYPTIIGHFDGAYAGDPFSDILFYQNSDGSPGDIPFGGPPLLFQPYLTVIPAPSALGALTLGTLALVRRQRR